VGCQADLRSLGATIIDPGPHGALFQSCVDKYVPLYRNKLFTAQFTCFMLLNYSVRGLLLGNAYIDERERELRDRATAVAYRVLTGAVAVLSTYAVAAYLFKLGLPMPSTAQQLLLLLIPLGWLATSLPQSVLAWTLPDPEA